MSLAGDFGQLMTLWGQTLTIVRRSVSYADSGSPTVTWSQVSSVTGMIQPATRPRGDTMRVEAGIKSYEYNEVYLPTTTTVDTGDRIRPFGWAAGDNEYEVIEKNDFSPSHFELLTIITRGHAG